MVFGLDELYLAFPDPALADPDGLLAIGGDLSAERLKNAYASGIFPWFSAGDPILWFAPHERCVIFPERVKISKSMRKVLLSEQFRITWDQAFEQVIKACASIDRTKQGQDGTWITDDMQEAYLNLHQLGMAHSVEVWKGQELVGGLYGVIVKQVFCGESMFSQVSNASKVALISLCRSGQFKLIDCQLPNPHLMSLGAELIPSQEYLKILKEQG
jgi:leucyl/phenylalanyl-tRNA--protein transferase